MPQLTAGIIQVGCTYDFTINGGAISAGTTNLGVAIRGGSTIIGIYYSVFVTLATAAVNVDCGFGFSGGTGFIDPADTVAVLNANMAKWKRNTIYVPVRIAVTATTDCGIYFTNSSVITAGKIGFSFAVMQNSI